MARIRNLVFILIILVPAIAFPGSSGSSEVKGRIIYYKNDVIEVKKGSNEFQLYLDDSSQVTRHGNSASQNDIAICQGVKVIYKNVEGKNIILIIEIQKESDCISK